MRSKRPEGCHGNGSVFFMLRACSSHPGMLSTSWHGFSQSANCTPYNTVLLSVALRSALLLCEVQRSPALCSAVLCSPCPALLYCILFIPFYGILLYCILPYYIKFYVSVVEGECPFMFLSRHAHPFRSSPTPI